MIHNLILPWLWQCDLEGATHFVNSGIRIAERRFDVIVTAAFNVRVWIPEWSIGIVLPINDHDDVPSTFFDLAVAACRAHLGDVLVHCNGGKNRSVAVASAIAWGCDRQPFDATFEKANSSPTREIMTALKRWKELGERR